MKRVCIVTPDLVGPCRNGGIGAHCYWLARNLVDARYDVTVLYTGPFVTGSPEYWKRKFAGMGITFEALMDIPDRERRVYGGGRAATHSRKVMQFLLDNHFGIVHFQEWHADGFIPIQAKKSGMAFDETVLAVTMHSSRQWIREGMLRWSEQPLEDMMLDYCERYCVENADILFSPSMHMFEWAEKKRWRLNDNRHVIPYCYIPGPKPEPTVAPDTSHVIFFGRLETRKGLEVFLAALSDVLGRTPGKFSKVTFLGKEGQTHNGNSKDDIERFQKAHPDMEVEMLTTLDTFGAMEYLKKTGGVAAIPSLLDNYPYTVIECIQNSVQFIAAKTGGIPEMIVSENRLFEPTAEGLSHALGSLDEIFASDAVYAYSPERARDAWLNIHEKLLSGSNGSNRQDAAGATPKVSVCVQCRDDGKFLPVLLSTLESSQYPNLDVVVNDCSNDESARMAFEEAAYRYRGSGWTFLPRQGGNDAHARDYAVSHAQGEYIIFMDSDNVPLPEMVEVFMDAITASGSDCMTSHLYAFEGPGPPNAGTSPHFVYVPIGACIEAGLFENVFGDSSFIIRKKVIDELGGIGGEFAGSEGYGMLLNLCLKGYKLDVVPRQLFWSRRDRNRVDDGYVDRQRIIKLYAEHCPEDLCFIWPHIVSMNKQLVRQKDIKYMLGIGRISGWLQVVYQNEGFFNGTKHVVRRVLDAVKG